MQKNNYGMPLMGLGTYGRRGAEGVAAMLAAIEIGYRHLDTAQSYDTERECGEALRQSGLARADMFITTKIDMPNFGSGKLIPSLRRSLDTIGIDQVDLTLIHWPSPHNQVPLPVYIEQLAEAQALGLTKTIGVSNFTIALLQQTQAILGAVPIANNQVECHPYLQNRKLVDFCAAAGIPVTAYQPIAKGTLVGDPVLEPLAAGKGCTVAQLAIAYAFARGLAAIPTSGKRERLASNFAAQELSLTPADMATIASLDRGTRRINPASAPAWD
ncbi:aldo/keto reductase [Devosia sp. Root436]|jgi:2,5-diketo-D-gluconate reductase B|uniref:aldo/keto reductase n=1 Tax=Devosia sp. Root436 TaxID=1736537 RepID=UPI00070207B4|nr:aldo/keto reductase [Devosia sp. Root436]KQX40093.1 aldo/keto reductase [Devosia sp. Root436]